MNEPIDLEVSSNDAALLQRFGAVARAADPAPELTVELARAAFELRRLDAELAELVADSVDDARRPAGVRGGGDARLLSFEAGSTCLEVEVHVDAPRRTLLGQVVPSPDFLGGVVRLEIGGGAVRTCELDPIGGFRFDDVPTGLARLHVERPGTGDVTTSWVNV